jgi:hypothetical protein
VPDGLAIVKERVMNLSSLVPSRATATSVPRRNPGPRRPTVRRAAVGAGALGIGGAGPVAVVSLGVGSAALGALSVGALAIGALGIGRLAVRRAVADAVRLGRVEIDELVVHRYVGPGDAATGAPDAP